MKLGRKHIGQLVDNGADGSWVYQLVAVNRTHLLFYDFRGTYVVEKKGYSDWQKFRPRKPWPKRWLESGWTYAKGDR